MKRYLVIGGEVTSGTDGDRHYIGPMRVAQLYGVAPAECIFMDSENDPRMHGVRRGDFTVLYPQWDGRYAMG